MDTRHEVYLHGYLGDTYGREPIVIYSTDLIDTIKGLTCNLGKEFLREIKSGSWHIVKGKPLQEGDVPSEDDKLLTENELTLTLHQEELHIYPRVEGAVTLAAIGSIAGALGASTGTVTAIGTLGGTLGATTAVAAGSTAGILVNTALVLASTAALSAVVSAVSSSPAMDYDNAEVDRAPSFLYNGTVNVVEQGGAVPLVYGKHLTGSTVISANMVSHELGAIANELPIEDTNFLLPLSGNWSGDGATLTIVSYDKPVYIPGSGISYYPISVLEVVKTANLVYGGAVLTTSLEADTEYKVTVEVIGNLGDKINLQGRDGVTQLGYKGITLSTTVLESAFISVTYKTLAAQVNPTILIYPDEAAPSGRVLKIISIKAERVHA